MLLVLCRSWQMLNIQNQAFRYHRLDQPCHAARVQYLVNLCSDESVRDACLQVTGTRLDVVVHCDNVEVC